MDAEPRESGRNRKRRTDPPGQVPGSTRRPVAICQHCYSALCHRYAAMMTSRDACRRRVHKTAVAVTGALHPNLGEII